MAWIPTAVPPTRAHGGLFLKRYWLHCIRSVSSRPTPSLNLQSDHEGEQPSVRKKAIAAYVKKMKYRPQPLPQPLIEAVNLAIADFSLTELQRDAYSLTHYLSARHPPTEDSVMQAKAQSLEHQYISQHETVNEQKLKHYVIKNLKSQMYHWQPLEVVSPYEAAVYLVARLATEYASLLYCLRQVALRDAAFRPHAVLNYGSAVGAGLWVARQLWGGAVTEYVGIERRLHLLELAARLAHGAPDPSVFLRPQLPASSRLQFPLVVAAHALAELPSQRARLELVSGLWERTAPGGRLTLLEAGNNAGYLLVLEARDLVLRLAERPDGPPAHVEAPCPHDTGCPRFTRSLTPCHFRVAHWGLPLGGAAQPEPARATLSFVTLRKAARLAADRQWPRVVQPVLSRPRHVVCRLCTSRGKLEEIVVTKRRHGSDMYQCAKAAQWGDTMPIELQDGGQDADTGS